ncbi:hypothetical protein [Nostoc sp.]
MLVSQFALDSQAIASSGGTDQLHIAIAHIQHVNGSSIWVV